MSANNVLPAVLMLAASGSLSVSGPSASTHAATNAAQAPVKPIVALFKATNEAAVPERLDRFANLLALRTGYSANLKEEDDDDDDPPLPRCGTITGSPGGWDDSRQDC